MQGGNLCFVEVFDVEVEMSVALWWEKKSNVFVKVVFVVGF